MYADLTLGNNFPGGNQTYKQYRFDEGNFNQRDLTEKTVLMEGRS